MATRPVLFNRTSLDQQLKDEFARIDANFQTANFCLSVSTYSGLFAAVCSLGAIATEPEKGKQRSLSNKIFLAAAALGVAVTVISVVASFASTFFSFRRSNNL